LKGIGIVPLTMKRNTTMTRMEQARAGIITEEMKQVALAEGHSPEYIRQGIADGTIIITRNNRHTSIAPLGVGKGLSTKINANIGTSRDKIDLDTELAKLEVLTKYGAHAVMDLSTGGDIGDIRRTIMEKSSITIGTVPIYQAAVEAEALRGSLIRMTDDDLFRVIEEHGEDGVDFITVHCGMTLNSVERLKQEGRIMDVVSRGGSFLVEWMIVHKEDNPLYTQYDRLLEIAKKYDMTLSLGDGMRPGALADATDRAQIQELLILGELTDRAWKAGVQVMIEGPGHVPINQVEMNMKIQKELCKGAPFYVLGPLVTDIAPGYDHITSAIGGAMAAAAGADFLCYVTPAEHLRLPSIDDVREGVIASRIAAHAGDIAKGVKGAIEQDIEMSKRRKKLNWEGMFELCVDPDKARAYRDSSRPQMDDVCTMCAEFCAIKTVNEYLRA